MLLLCVHKNLLLEFCISVYKIKLDIIIAIESVWSQYEMFLLVSILHRKPFLRVKCSSGWQIFNGKCFYQNYLFNLKFCLRPILEPICYSYWKSVCNLYKDREKFWDIKYLHRYCLDIIKDSFLNNSNL